MNVIFGQSVFIFGNVGVLSLICFFLLTIRRLKIESNLSGGFKFSIQYWQEQSPLMSNDFIIDHQEILELNRYLAKSYSRGKHWSVVTYDNGVKSDLYIRWSAEGDCQKAEAQL